MSFKNLSWLALCGVTMAGFSACSVDPVYLSPPEAAQGAAGSGGPTEVVCGDDCFMDAHLDPKSLSVFSQEPTQSAPSIVYPLDGTMLPNNVELLSVHFKKGSEAAEVFEVSVTDGDLMRRVYIPCLAALGGGCLYHLPESFWGQTARLFSGKDITLSLRSGGSKGVSAPARIAISFSPRPVLGGLYYWSAELMGIYRLAFGGRQAEPFISPRSAENPDDCAGCHAVSRDGTTIGYTQGAAASDDVFQNAAFSGALRVAKVTAPEQPLIEPSGAGSDSGMLTLSSDGSRVVTAFDYKLTLRNTTTGDVLDEYVDQVLGQPFFPEFSPDNSSLVLTLSSQPDSEIAVRSGSIYVLSLNGDSFGSVRQVVAATQGEAFYYPTWSPDGQYIAYVKGPGGTAPSLKSYDQAESMIYLVSAEGGNPIALAAVNEVPHATTTWPKFAPFEQCEVLGQDPCPMDKRLFFLSFSSKRQVGLLANLPGQTIRSQLWMSAVATSKLAQGQDPSSPPFWIPHQAPDTRNHLGYWTEALRCDENVPCGQGLICSDRGECEANVR